MMIWQFDHKKIKLALTTAMEMKMLDYEDKVERAKPNLPNLLFIMIAAMMTTITTTKKTTTQWDENDVAD